MRILIMFFAWFSCSVMLLIVCLALLTAANTPAKPDRTRIAYAYSPPAKATESTGETYILRPEVLGTFSADIIAADARPDIVAAFLEQYSCPLTPYDYYARQFVDAADRHNLDFRMLPAISMQESNCCKRIPDDSYNCWGYGIYGDKVTRFSSYEEGMDRVAATLETKYVKNGLLEPEEIMRKYTPQSKGSWAAGVLHFMAIMNDLSTSPNK
ncbi:hypothetical protein A3B56_03400 [Candidatus Roizmanbacteria bacterium RIFCSPLOWO2_01_FULL_45_11]|uniref:Mannosyl-glycoprotein endo-beta-N-acetylglucosamidase-like domain-containing protein n=1 Tax=Candidatus Roizmanbacteria bacterium RIFCSPLOWO2_01_FULL_45_11 TaxID=1802070 RepID=A0A1F7JDK5_9BACT|nr:MAG: hypothetical protein A3B56_03400 [Candidatus Roizmanbacteria bacterium RIFCSPLOWO2_01_FULL_45_11]